ncbi:GRP-2 [Symbiodinium sp. CCMP2592]|nr:GRP-2 [Symbiodinium sp. CCMP2592]
MALTGVVKKYDNAKGFGFIVPTGSRTDLFVRCTDVIGGTLQEGDKVTFDEGLNERTGKPKAFRVAGGSGPAPGGKGDPRDGKQGFVAGPVPGGCGCSPWGSPAPCGLMLGGGCGLGAGKAAPMPGGCGIKSGVVKFFHDEKGFGFIKQNGGGNDLFVHRSDVIDAPLNEGDHVQYSEVVDKRSGRMKAHQVTGGTGARKPPQKKGAGKGGKGKGGKGSVPTEPSLPNPGMAMMAMGCGCGGSGGCGGGCGGCGQRMGGCSGNCGSLQMSGNSCKAPRPREDRHTSQLEFL